MIANTFGILQGIMAFCLKFYRIINTTDGNGNVNMYKQFYKVVHFKANPNSISNYELMQ